MVNHMKTVVLFLLLTFSLSSYGEVIEYSVFESASNNKVCSGKKVYSITDVILNPYKSQGRDVVEKFVELEQGYKIGARLFPDSKLTGFGLLAGKSNSDFSWEWCDKKDGNVFVKLQGGNLVKVAVSGLPMLEILSEVEFLDDTRLGFILNRSGEDETHYIIVKKGSVLKFN